nr:RNA-directed DNA polymerase, eukaryota, reverse transcriptase zinc-binding domain protein [Tanacetum cinerariifolium]
MVHHLADMEMVPHVFENIIDYLHPMAHKRLARSIFGKLILAASSYFVWLERNARLFKNVKRMLEEIKDVIMVTVRLKLLTFKFKDSAIEEPIFEIASDDVEQTVDDKVSDAGRPPHTNADENQADATSKIPKKDRFKETLRFETLDPDWNTVKIVGDTLEQSWFNEMVQAKKPPLTFDELMRNKERTYVSSITKTPAVRYTMEGIEDMVPTLWSQVIIAYEKDAALEISH